MEAPIKIIVSVILIGCFTSCVQNKYFFKCNRFNTVKAGKRGDPITGQSSTPDTFMTFIPKKGFKGKLTEQEGYTVIEPVADSLLHPYSDSTILILHSKEDAVSYHAKIDQLKSKYFIPDVITPLTLESEVNKQYQGNVVVKYFDSKPVLQTLSIPIKIRPKLNTPALKDSFPGQVSTGVNLGMAFGWKLSLNYYKPKPNFMGLKITSVSLTPGVFYGLGATSLTKDNTRNPVIEFGRSALTHSLGGFAMFGFNNINIGYAIGWDFVTGPNKSAWLYQGKVWHGIAISLDLIK